MPKTLRPFDWEVYDQDGEFIDILTMTRDEMKEYKNGHKGYTISEIGYTDDGGDDTWDVSSKKDRNIYSVRIPKRGRKLQDVY